MHLFYKKYYYINSFDAKSIDNQDKETLIIFRDYFKKKIDKNLIVNIRNYCKKKSLKFIISNNFKLGLELNLDGVYIPSFNNDFSHLNYSLKTDFIVIGSAHNIREIRTKEKQKVKEIVISPLFSKKNYLGIYKFLLLKKLTKKKVIPLGGILKKNIKLLNFVNVKSFAGISFFQKKSPQNDIEGF